MTEIAIIGDVHAAFGRLTASLGLLEGVAVDLAVLTGDVGADPPWDPAGRKARRGQHDASVRRVLDAVRAALGCPVVFVPGNHDLRDAAPVPGIVNVDGRVARVAGFGVAGLGGAGPAHFGFPYEWTEAQAEAALASLPGDSDPDVDIFLSHTPPAGTALDRTLGGQHVGSVAVGRWIERLRPRLFVCGHIHEAWGVAQVGGVPSINAGALGPPAEQDIVWRVTWQAASAPGARRTPIRILSIRRDRGGTVLTRSWDLGDVAPDP